MHRVTGTVCTLLVDIPKVGIIRLMGKNEYLSHENCIFARKSVKYALFAIFLWLYE